MSRVKHPPRAWVAPVALSALLILSALLVAGCGTVGFPGLTDADYADAILGTWWGEYKTDDAAVHVEKTFLPGGVASGFISVRRRSRGGVTSGRVEFTSEWDIRDGVVFTRNVRSEPAGAIAPDGVTADRILSFREDRIEFMSLADESTFVRYRKSPWRPR